MSEKGVRFETQKLKRARPAIYISFYLPPTNGRGFCSTFNGVICRGTRRCMLVKLDADTHAACCVCAGMSWCNVDFALTSFNAMVICRASRSRSRYPSQLSDLVDVNGRMVGDTLMPAALGHEDSDCEMSRDEAEWWTMSRAKWDCCGSTETLIGARRWVMSG